jgi:hypothetical protein
LETPEDSDSDAPKAAAADRQSSLKALITRGREQGYLTRAEALSHLPPDLIAPDQFDDVVAMVADMGIPIFTAPPTEAELIAHRTSVDARSARPGTAATNLKKDQSVVPTDAIGEPVVALHIGAEGGAIRLIAQPLSSGWRYRYTLLDQSDVWLDEGNSSVRRQSPWVREWQAALALLDRYPWAMLHPIAVHADFRTLVLAAVRERLATAPTTSRVTSRLAGWMALCG